MTKRGFWVKAAYWPEATEVEAIYKCNTLCPPPEWYECVCRLLGILNLQHSLIECWTTSCQQCTKRMELRCQPFLRTTQILQIIEAAQFVTNFIIEKRWEKHRLTVPPTCRSSAKSGSDVIASTPDSYILLLVMMLDVIFEMSFSSIGYAVHPRIGVSSRNTASVMPWKQCRARKVRRESLCPRNFCV